MSNLFKPLKIGKKTINHRVVLAPLTRFRSTDTHVPLPFVAEYYAQRASVPGTLLISEGTFISAATAGYPHAPGLWNSEQISAWKPITDAVHAKGGVIYSQLAGSGRDITADLAKKQGLKVRSSSANPLEGGVVPEELTEEEIWAIIAEFKQAAINAIEAGFDGVEVHGANGYIVDQFTQEACNTRTDAWGGSIEKRSKFAIEVLKATVDAIGADRVGFRLSPYSTFQGMGTGDIKGQFSYLLEQVKGFKLAYLHLVEARISGAEENGRPETIDYLVDLWDNTSPVLLAGGFTPESAKEATDGLYKDKDVAIVFGRHFISNPDLPFRIQHGIPLTPYDRSKFYAVGEKDGYTTWENSREFVEVVG
jgi:NADPH2 dehydrogenase